MKKYILLLVVISISFPGCIKNNHTVPPASPPVDICPNRHEISLRFGLLSPSATYYHVSYSQGTNPNPYNYLLPQSKGKIVFSFPLSGLYGCDCQAGLPGTYMGIPVIQFLTFHSMPVNDPTPFTAYVMIGADTVRKQKSTISGGLTVAEISLLGCLQKIK